MCKDRAGWVTVLVALSLLACPLGAVWAQVTAAQQPATPPPGSVLQRIPPGCMGFLAVKDVQAFTGRIDAFIKAISPAGQPLLPMPVLELIKAQIRLGETFDSRGGFAVVMLDPQQYGVDLVSVITGKGEKPFNPADLPVVFVLPGTEPEKMLATFQPVKEGQDYKLTGMGEPSGWARQVSGYVLLSPNRKAIAAMAEVPKSVETQLSAADRALVNRNDATVWLNFRIVGPILDAAIVRMEKQAAEMKKRLEGGELPIGMGPQQIMLLSLAQAMPQWRQTIKQMEDMVAGVRIPKEGILLEANATFLADSLIGKSLAGYTFVAKPLLDRLPTMPYVVAAGFQGGPHPPKAEAAKQMDEAMAMEPFKSLSAEAKAKFRNLALAANEQVEGMQLYVGQNATGTSQLAMAAVWECKSAQKMRELLPDAVALAMDVISSSQDPNVKKIAVKYSKDAESLGERKLDVISLEIPGLAEAPEEARVIMKKVLGDDKLRLLVASADERVLVTSLGGGKEFLAAALKTAVGGGKLADDPGVVKSLKMLPERRLGVGVFSVPNLMSLIMSAIKEVAAAEGGQPPPINLQMPPSPPLAASVGIEGRDVTLNGFVPVETVAAVVKMVTGAMMMQMGPPMPPGEDF